MLQKNIDKETSMTMFIDNIIARPYQFKDKAKSFVIDLGGSTGWFGAIFKTKKNTIISMDIHADKLLEKYDYIDERVQYIKGDLLELPFKDNIADVVIARASLHHIPRNIHVALSQIKRILKDDGIIIIQEPNYLNPFAYIIRNYFPMEKWHDEDEKPFKIKDLIKDISLHFHIKEIQYYYLFSYPGPHIIARLPNILKSCSRKLLYLIVRLDNLLMNCKFLQNYCGYISIIGDKHVI